MFFGGNNPFVPDTQRAYSEKKTIVIQDPKVTEEMIVNDWGYNGSNYWGEEKDRFFYSQLIDFDEEYDKLVDLSKELVERGKTSGTTVEIKSLVYDIPPIPGFEDTDWGKGGVSSPENYLVFTGTNEKYNIFNVTYEQLKNDATNIIFNVPVDSYIIINVEGEDNTTVSLDKIDHIMSSSSNGGLGTAYREVDGPYLSDSKGNTVSFVTIGSVNTSDYNNNERAGKILYNIPNAKKFELAGNFMGSILAPNAYGKNPEEGRTGTSGTGCVGHLSGNLVCKGYNGTMEFGYLPTSIPAFPVTTATISISKVLDGRNAEKGEFTFGLYDADGNEVERITSPALTNGESANLSFTPISFSKPGKYTYTVREIVDGLASKNITSNNEEYEVIVNVTKNEVTEELTAEVSKTADELRFTNTYTPAPVSFAIPISKVLEGRNAEKGEFIFELYDSNDTRIDSITSPELTNGVAAEMTFKSIPYDKPGEYKYTVKESKGEKEGVNYDGTVFEVTVTVSLDETTGTLSASVNKTASQLRFKNTYTASTSATISISKVLDGRDAKAGEFKFELYECDTKGDRIDGGISKIVSNQDLTSGIAQTISFGEIVYTDSGYHYYKVREIKGNDNKIDYDDTVYDVIVNVTDNGDGSLIKEVMLNGKLVSEGDIADKLIFTNTYTPVLLPEAGGNGVIPIIISGIVLIFVSLRFMRISNKVISRK